jgi:hypothetical protein
MLKEFDCCPEIRLVALVQEIPAAKPGIVCFRIDVPASLLCRMRVFSYVCSEP